MTNSIKIGDRVKIKDWCEVMGSRVPTIAERRAMESVVFVVYNIIPLEVHDDSGKLLPDFGTVEMRAAEDGEDCPYMINTYNLVKL